MEKIIDSLFYSAQHIWLKQDSGIGILGITEYAKEQLIEIIYIEFPAIRSKVQQEEKFASIESSKTIIDLIAPVSGEVVEINEAINKDPGIINKDQYNEGWIIKLKMDDTGQVEKLLSPDKYKNLLISEDSQ